MRSNADISMIDYNIQLTHRAKDDIINIGDYITYQLLEPETSRFLQKVCGRQ